MLCPGNPGAFQLNPMPLLSSRGMITVVIPTRVVINYVPWAAVSAPERAEVVSMVLRAINAWLYSQEA